MHHEPSLLLRLIPLAVIDKYREATANGGAVTMQIALELQLDLEGAPLAMVQPSEDCMVISDSSGGLTILERRKTRGLWSAYKAGSWSPAPPTAEFYHATSLAVVQQGKVSFTGLLNGNYPAVQRYTRSMPHHLNA